jgi:hypothetical protein
VAPAPGKITLPRVTQAADETDVLCEQFHFLLEHALEAAHMASHKSTCRDCRRYRLLNKVLMQPFKEKRKNK